MNNRHWTTEECNLLVQHYPVNGAGYCVQILDRSRESIKKKACRMGLGTCITSSGRPQKQAIEVLDDNKVLARCKIHGVCPHYLSKGKITGCVECVRLFNKNKPVTDAKREYDRQKQRRYRSTTLGLYTSRLRSYLRSFLGRKKGCFRHLPYSPQQLRDHLDSIRQNQNNCCPGCGASYGENNFHIDHVIPISTANTQQDILDLFSLENLSLLCPACNLVKGSKIEGCYA